MVHFRRNNVIEKEEGEINEKKKKCLRSCMNWENNNRIL